MFRRTASSASRLPWMSEITAYICQVRRSLYGGLMIAKSRLKGSSPCGNISKRFPLRGPVAQGIEQRFPGPCVAGSNPARPASFCPVFSLPDGAFLSLSLFAPRTGSLSPELRACYVQQLHNLVGRPRVASAHDQGRYEVVPARQVR